MYNTDLPSRADLPTSAQLKRSSWIAGLTASAILAFVVLPSEYAVDPTGIGRVLGLTQMGAIKMQLAQEAAQDAAAAGGNPELTARLVRIETVLQGLASRAPAPTPPAGDPVAAVVEGRPLEVRPTAPEAQRQPAASSEWRDEVSFTLPPGQGVEVKLVMEQGAQARFHWTANGAVVNYDTHGDGGGRKVSYEQGRGVPEKDGILEAAFTGNHGWFWRNRTNSNVTITLRTTGAYSEMKRMI
ncbi:MAG: hypothetical protein J0H17_04410 [Rhizobiales bacterium]|nr:hypothetical protein [Hyphomicrobiales bacterium]